MLHAQGRVSNPAGFKPAGFKPVPLPNLPRLR
jgi:hypothetical protein